MRYPVLVLVTVGALACRSATDPTRSPDFSAGIGEPFDLRVGEAVSLANGLTIGFSAVAADSRCPTSVTCVWAGDGAVAVVIRRLTEVVEDTLHTTVDPKVVTIGGIEIQLTELAPYPAVPGTIPQGEYLATFSTRYAQ